MESDKNLTLALTLKNPRHMQVVVNVVNGQIGSTEVNVHNADTAKTKQMNQF